jgi:hypothetical protein
MQTRSRCSIVHVRYRLHHRVQKRVGVGVSVSQIGMFDCMNVEHPSIHLQANRTLVIDGTDDSLGNGTNCLGSIADMKSNVIHRQPKDLHIYHNSNSSIKQ